MISLFYVVLTSRDTDQSWLLNYLKNLGLVISSESVFFKISAWIIKSIQVVSLPWPILDGRKRSILFRVENERSPEQFVAGMLKCILKAITKFGYTSYCFFSRRKWHNSRTLIESFSAKNIFKWLLRWMTDSISNHAMRSSWGCQNILAWK